MSVVTVLLFGWVLFIAVYLSFQGGRARGRDEVVEEIERDLAPTLLGELLKQGELRSAVHGEQAELLRKKPPWK